LMVVSQLFFWLLSCSCTVRSKGVRHDNGS
jgi:hypothetical protein